MFANFLSEKEITVKQPPFDFAALPRANEDHIRAALSDLREFLEEEEDRLDAEYLEFVQTIGAGTLGRAKIFSPTTSVSHPADIRLHALLLKRRVADTQYNHSFDMSTLLPFAHDVKEGFWFAWSTKGKRKSMQKVFCFDDKEDSAPPKVVAESFRDFIENVALGTRMIELELFRPRNISDGDDDDDATNDTSYVPPKLFVKFADNR